jgi:hypothetical protein
MDNKDKKYKKLNQLEAYSTAYHIIEDTYNTEEGRKFIHYLIDSFIERDIALTLFSKGKLFDCITKSALRSMYNMDNRCEDPEVNEIMSHIRTASTISDKFDLLKKASDLVISRYPELSTNRVALRSKYSNKLIGMEEFQALVDFTQDQVTKGNKTIIKMVKYSKFRNSPNFKNEVPSKVKSKSKNNHKNKVEDKEITKDMLQQLVDKYSHK